MSVRSAPYESPNCATPATGKTYPRWPSGGVTFSGRCFLCFLCRARNAGYRVAGRRTVVYSAGAIAAVVTGSVVVVAGTLVLAGSVVVALVSVVVVVVVTSA